MQPGIPEHFTCLYLPIPAYIPAYTCLYLLYLPIYLPIHTYMAQGFKWYLRYVRPGRACYPTGQGVRASVCAYV